jgi:hypothetical protein
MKHEVSPSEGVGVAHADPGRRRLFTALSDGACDRYAALVLRYGAELAYGLMIGAGHAADVIVVNSRRRMLAHLRAGDAAEATCEMENHLSALNFMGRLAITDATFRPPPQRDKFKFLYLERTVATPCRDRTPSRQAGRGAGMTRPRVIGFRP